MFEGYNKADRSSATIPMGRLLISAVIDGNENLNVLLIPGHSGGILKNTDINEFVLMCLKGKIAEIMVKVDQSICRKYVVTG